MTVLLMLRQTCANSGSLTPFALPALHFMTLAHVFPSSWLYYAIQHLTSSPGLVFHLLPFSLPLSLSPSSFFQLGFNYPSLLFVTSPSPFSSSRLYLSSSLRPSSFSPLFLTPPLPFCVSCLFSFPLRLTFSFPVPLLLLRLTILLPFFVSSLSLSLHAFSLYLYLRFIPSSSSRLP